jgi:hypothetical protein
VFYLDVAYTCMLQTYVSSVSYVCLQVFHLNVAYVCNGFQMFSDVFVRISDAFKCFISSFCMLHLDVSKSRLDVAHRMRVGSGRRHERHLGWRGRRSEWLVRCLGRHGPAAGALLSLTC